MSVNFPPYLAESKYETTRFDAIVIQFMDSWSLSPSVLDPRAMSASPTLTVSINGARSPGILVPSPSMMHRISASCDRKNFIAVLTPQPLPGPKSWRTTVAPSDFAISRVPSELWPSTTRILEKSEEASSKSGRIASSSFSVGMTNITRELSSIVEITLLTDCSTCLTTWWLL